MNHVRIFTTDDSWEPTPGNRRFGHLGTRDRENLTNFYDYPGKTSALLAGALELQSEIAVNRYGVPLKPIVIERSSRIPYREQLLKGHTADYLRRFEAAAQEALSCAQAGRDPIVNFGKEADVSAGTYRAAIRSVGAALDAVDVALQAPETTAFALVWPPGHHAEPAQAMGFCYLSTAALAALYARDHTIQLRPGHTNRVVLIDIDHHRGNGSAAVLAHKENILFIDQLYKSHYDEHQQRYTDGELDPFSNQYRGAGKEFPYLHDDSFLGVTAHPTISAPNLLKLEFEGTQHADSVIHRFISDALPRIRDFNPDVVMWSVGVDSAKGDPVGGLGLEPESYYTLIKGMRLAFPAARHCGFLEGGYHHEIGPRCLKPVLLALHDETSQVLFGDASTELLAAFKQVR